MTVELLREDLLRLVEGHLRRIREIEERRFRTTTGKYLDLYRYDVTLKPRERKLLFEAYGAGRLLDHVACVTMPDDTPPEIQFEIQLDDTLILDWTCEEYHSLLGFSAIPGYGGYTVYDTVNRRYAWWTTYVPELGDFAETLKVWLRNLTGVEVHVDVWDVELRLTMPARYTMY